VAGISSPVPQRHVSVVALRAWRALCRLLLAVLPARRHAIVHGWPDDEGNSVEVVRALVRRYRGRVYWLLADTGYPGPAYAASELRDGPRLTRVFKGSLRALVLALTAETTFFTHGLFTAVVPPEDRLVVNVWHGDGPKLAQDTHLIRSTVAVAGSQLWGRQRSDRFHLPASRVAIVGNPRVEQFRVAPREQVLRRLGLDAERCTVLWLPTYRAAAGPRGRTWSDGEHLSSSVAVGELVDAMRTTADRLGLQLLVKPHPLDADLYHTFDLPVLDHEALAQAGVTLYQLLSAADAVISDVSSVWVDFLVLDRPVGFYVPDLDELQRRRGLNVADLGALLPGPRIQSPQDVVDFLEGVVSRQAELLPSSYPSSTTIGVANGDGVPDRLLDWLDDFQRARGRPVLFSPVEGSSDSPRQRP
jgi:CDP-glycerol glycerophosphotransferase